jgi:hypothetical protein
LRKFEWAKLNISTKLRYSMTPADAPKDAARTLWFARRTRAGMNTTDAPIAVDRPAQHTIPRAVPTAAVEGVEELVAADMVPWS